MQVWSSDRLTELRKLGRVCINPVIFAEFVPSLSLENANVALGSMQISREGLTYEMGWRAGIAHAAYRRAGGTRDRTLPDFLIGAHAAILDYKLLTRDASRYRTYFPELNIIAPDSHP